MPIFNIDNNRLAICNNINDALLVRAFDANNSIVYENTDQDDWDDAYLPGRELLFEDNFTSFNTDNWSYEIGALRNSELQFYRSTNNVSIENNGLVITAKREPYLGKDWTSGSITSQTKKYWQYGRFEAKIKLPKVAGAFPAFWTLGESHIIVYPDEETGIKPSQNTGKYPDCGEIDIMEHYPGASNRLTSGAYTDDGTGSSTPKSVGRVYTEEFDPSVYHVYALEWTENKLQYFIDNQKILEHNNPTNTIALRRPHHIMINLAIGPIQNPPDNVTQEMKMYVDWVRVYAPAQYI